MTYQSPWVYCPNGCDEPWPDESIEESHEKLTKWSLGIGKQLDQHNFLLMDGRTIRLTCPVCGIDFHADIDLEPQFRCYPLSGNAVIDDRKEARY